MLVVGLVVISINDIYSWGCSQACSHLYLCKGLQAQLQPQLQITMYCSITILVGKWLQAQLQLVVYNCSHFPDVSHNVICSCACSCLYLCKWLQAWLQPQLQITMYCSITILVGKWIQDWLQAWLQAQLQIAVYFPSQYWHLMAKHHGYPWCLPSQYWHLMGKLWHNIMGNHDILPKLAKHHGGVPTCHTGPLFSYQFDFLEQGLTAISDYFINWLIC